MSATRTPIPFTTSILLIRSCLSSMANIMPMEQVGRGWMTFPVLHSTDLVHWRNLGMALQPLAGAFASYWAPEVAYDNGTFYMYYSAGGPEGEGHQLRVATAQHPAGPFQDSGRVLTPDDPFTIDAHPFRDEDGTWYLFYCHDFLDGDRVGTGILVDRMVDMLTLRGRAPNGGATSRRMEPVPTPTGMEWPRMGLVYHRGRVRSQA